MSERPSTQLIERHAESTRRFDYFVTGIALALVGWLGGRSGPIVLSHPADIGYLASLVCLLGAAFSGLKRIEASNTGVRLNALALIGEETAATRQRAVQGPGTLVDASTGAELEREEIKASIVEQLRLAKDARSLLEKTSEASRRWYRMRTWLLVAGLLLLIVGRLLEGV